MQPSLPMHKSLCNRNTGSSFTGTIGITSSETPPSMDRRTVILISFYPWVIEDMMTKLYSRTPSRSRNNQKLIIKHATATVDFKAAEYLNILWPSRYHVWTGIYSRRATTYKNYREPWGLDRCIIMILEPKVRKFHLSDSLYLNPKRFCESTWNKGWLSAVSSQILRKTWHINGTHVKAFYLHPHTTHATSV